MESDILTRDFPAEGKGSLCTAEAASQAGSPGTGIRDGGHAQTWLGERKAAMVAHAMPNPYETPSCQGTHSPRSGRLLFFRRVGLGIGDLRCRALPSCPIAVQTARVCTKPVWRFSRPGDGECRDARASATSHHLGPLIPSSAPGRLHGCRAPVRCRLGGGAAPVILVRPSPPMSEPERVSHQPPRAPGGWPRGS
jgi:hypothetical protein